MLRHRSVWSPLVLSMVAGVGVAYLQLVDEHGDGVELIVRVRRVSHGERDVDGFCDGIWTTVLRFWNDG